MVIVQFINKGDKSPGLTTRKPISQEKKCDEKFHKEGFILEKEKIKAPKFDKSSDTNFNSGHTLCLSG